MPSLSQMPAYSRRKVRRFETHEPVWVYLSCLRHKDVLRVRNLSSRGVFVVTHKTQPVGTKIEIDFLVEEGQVRTEAVVRHVEQDKGMGLEFTGVAHEDSPHLAALLSRLHGLSPSRPHLLG